MNAIFVEPGRLRTELALLQAALTEDGAGGHSEDWSEIATVFALVEPLRATSRVNADQIVEETTHRVTLRFHDAVASGMRFRRHARLFSIVTVHDPDESGRYLVCQVREEGR